MAKADNKAKGSKEFDDDSFFNSLKIEDDETNQDYSDLSPIDIFQQAIEDEKKAQSHTEDDLDDEEEDKINWKKRYEDSVKGVEKLKEKYSELERLVAEYKPFIPILETMKSDTGLYNVVKDYIEGGGQTPQSVKDDLNLPDDFVLDMDDAIRDPNSDSAKAFQKMVSMIANKIVNENIKTLTERQQREQELANRAKQLEEEKRALKAKYKLTDKDIEELDEWASKQRLDYEMLFKLKNLNSRDKNIISSLERDRSAQRNRMFNIPSSLRGVNSSTDTNKSDEDILFDAIAKSMNRGNIFYRK